ncbi:Vacuolar ATP synthase subunit C [Elasticomyces elasticus]|nr:Vacuolar ATP synthase subunit C [Elasticomyces elasticus]
MSRTQKFFLVSLPTSISPSSNRDDALTKLRSSVSTDCGTTYPFAIPSFKIGTLDALVQQADDLSKLSSACEGVVGKVADSLRGLLEGDEEKIAQQKNVNDHNDLRSKFNQYSSAKTALASAQRSRTGNLSQRSLTSVVNPNNILKPDDSEYLQQHLIAVPTQLIKDFLKSYETLAPMVVPRSSTLLAKDDEFSLYAVTVFKKHSAEFLHKCREKRWTPRDFKFTNGGQEEEDKESERLQKEERKVWGEALRLGRTGYSDACMAWIHVLALRVFVETVLRYGLPLDYVCGLVKTTPKLAKKAKSNLDSAYSELGGNAVGRDKKGRVQKDDSSMSADMQAAGQMGEDYTAYVFYEFEIV